MAVPVKITFGMIVCNGADFLAECLETAYPYAHAICIAEGATKPWMEANKWNTHRSVDGTIEIIKKFPDPQHKIRLYQQDQPYPEKNEQCNAYIRNVPADTEYLWQLDSDEFYLPEEMDAFLPVLARERYTYADFLTHHFFKNIDTVGVGGTGWGWHTPMPRLFQYKHGRKWATHRPPTIRDEKSRNLKDVKPTTGSKHGIYIRHYSYVTDKQVLEKMRYYQAAFKRNYMDTWYKNVWQAWDKDPKGVEAKYSTHPSGPGGKTAPYTGKHPAAILRKYGRSK